MLEVVVFMRYLDLAVILAYLAGITWFGARFRRGQKSLRDYFLGGRTAPWWAISLSIVSAETSTLTIMGTPALAFAGNLGFLQIVLGYLLARIVISFLFLPQYFRGEMFTAYELMRRRFGERIRKLTASIFLVTRALAEGVRVFAISLVISVVLGTGEIASIVLIVLLTLFYTFEGGMTAVIWTDVVQMSLYVFGAVVSFFVILGQIPGGWAPRGGGGRRRPQVLDFRFPLLAHHGILLAHLHFLGRPGGRLLPHHRQPRHRPAHGAAPVERAQRAPEPRRAAGELGGDFRAVHAVPADRRAALRVLRRHGHCPRPSRPTAFTRSSSGTICRRAWPDWRSRPSWPRPWPT